MKDSVMDSVGERQCRGSVSGIWQSLLLFTLSGFCNLYNGVYVLGVGVSHSEEYNRRQGQVRNCYKSAEG